MKKLTQEEVYSFLENYLFNISKFISVFKIIKYTESQIIIAGSISILNLLKLYKKLFIEEELTITSIDTEDYYNPNVFSLFSINLKNLLNPNSQFILTDEIYDLKYSKIGLNFKVGYRIISPLELKDQIKQLNPRKKLTEDYKNRNQINKLIKEAASNIVQLILDDSEEIWNQISKNRETEIVLDNLESRFKNLFGEKIVIILEPGLELTADTSEYADGTRDIIIQIADKSDLEDEQVLQGILHHELTHLSDFTRGGHPTYYPDKLDTDLDWQRYLSNPFEYNAFFNEWTTYLTDTYRVAFAKSSIKKSKFKLQSLSQFITELLKVPIEYENLTLDKVINKRLNTKYKKKWLARLTDIYYQLRSEL